MMSTPVRVCLGQYMCHKNPSVGYFRFSSTSKPPGLAASHTPNLVDKYLLVWLKKYPSVKDVPSRVTPGEMEKVRSWARIKINIAACIATALICVYMVKLGKDAAKRGESVRKMNEEWHKAQRKE